MIVGYNQIAAGRTISAATMPHSSGKSASGVLAEQIDMKAGGH